MQDCIDATSVVEVLVAKMVDVKMAKMGELVGSNGLLLIKKESSWPPKNSLGCILLLAGTRP